MTPLGGQYTEAHMRFVLAPTHHVPEPGGLALAGLGLLVGVRLSRSNRLARTSRH